MADRRPLASGVNQFAGADPDQVRAFITQETTPTASIVKSSVENDEEQIEVNSGTHTSSRKSAVANAPQRSPKRRPTRLQPVGLIPVTIRLRPETAGALKRASLERQLSGEETFTQQDIVENALEPWLEGEGYL